jgi:hypothetical protein
LLDAAGVEAFGQGEVGQIDAEVAIAVGATMLGVVDHEIDGTIRARPAQVVQGARGSRIAPGAMAAALALACRVVAASTFDTRLGKILNAGDTLGNVGDILAWTRHGSPSIRNAFPLFILRLPDPYFQSPVMLKSPSG